MRLTVLVPVKPFVEAKSRLAGVLTPEARADLCRRLLAGTLMVLRASAAPAEIIVVSRDAAARTIAEAHGCESEADPPGSDLNAALEAAADRAASQGADRVLVLPADLPMLAPPDVDALADAAPVADRCVVIAPDRTMDGTNALLHSLPAPIGYRFGTGSFAAHRAAAEGAGIVPVVVNRPGLARDLDTPDDLASLPPDFDSASGMFSQG